MKKTAKEIMGGKLRDLRKIHGMTQIELMDALGYTSTGMISQIETGQRGMDHERLYKAAKIFKVDLSVLLNEKEMSFKDLQLLIRFKEMLENEQDSEAFERIKKIMLGTTT